LEIDLTVPIDLSYSYFLLLYLQPQSRVLSYLWPTS
ncbi:helicase, partial [Streptococcus pneumoniae]